MPVWSLTWNIAASRNREGNFNWPQICTETYYYCGATYCMQNITKHVCKYTYMYRYISCVWPFLCEFRMPSALSFVFALFKFLFPASLEKLHHRTLYNVFLRLAHCRLPGPAVITGRVDQNLPLGAIKSFIPGGGVCPNMSTTSPFFPGRPVANLPPNISNGWMPNILNRGQLSTCKIYMLTFPHTCGHDSVCALICIMQNWSSH